jgi:hypothetical protein
VTGDEIDFICDEELQVRLKVWKMRGRCNIFERYQYKMMPGLRCDMCLRADSVSLISRRKSGPIPNADMDRSRGC